MDTAKVLRRKEEKARKNLPRIKVQIPDDCWLDVLKFLKCPNWSRKRYVSSQINGICRRNCSYLPRAMLEIAILWHINDFPFRKLDRKWDISRNKGLKNSIIAYDAIIPQNHIKQWFAHRGIVPEHSPYHSSEPPEDTPVEKTLFDKSYYELSAIGMCVLGHGRAWDPHHTLFYAHYHPRNKFSWASMEQFLTFLFHPSILTKEVRIFPINQKFVDVVKDKFAHCYPTHSNDNRASYIRCETFSVPLFIILETSIDELLDEFSESLKWLEQNVRADFILISPLHVPDHHPASVAQEICYLLNNFVFGALRTCARKEIRLNSNIPIYLFLSFVERFHTLAPIQCELPVVVIEQLSLDNFKRIQPHLGPNLIELEVQTQFSTTKFMSTEKRAEFLYVFEEKQNRMRISFCKNRTRYPSYSCETDYDCCIKCYATQPIS